MSRLWRTMMGLCIGAALAMPGLGRAQGSPGRRAAGGADNPADMAVVIYNENDPVSQDLANFYAGKRGIPPERVIGLKCSIEEEISREEYDDTLAGPLRKLFDDRGWWKRSPDKPGAEPASTVTSNRIEFLVLMRGIPLRIRQTSGYAGDFCNQPSPLKEANGACVDSELTVLGLFTRAISGFIPNPYFHSFSRFADARHPPGMMLVGRLDAPTGSMVKRMIEDSLAVEQTGLWGRCYLDGRGMAAGSGPLAEGDAWIARINADYAPFNVPTVYDNEPSMYAEAFPMTEAALYFGWYSEQPAGPFRREDFRFQPGAVACHIHSFSATSVRDPFKWWVGPLIEKGAAAVLGNVYEPYLSLTAHLDLFAEHLFDGYTLAECAYAAQPGLSWMNTVVGDPLYRPGLVWKNLDSSLDDDPAPNEPPLVTEGRAYRQGAMTWRARGAAAGADAIEKSAARLHSGRIYEGMALLLAGSGETARARDDLHRAMDCYKDPPDKVRVAFEEVRLLIKAGKKDLAFSLLKAWREKYAAEPSAAVLDGLRAGTGQ